MGTSVFFASLNSIKGDEAKKIKKKILIHLLPYCKFIQKGISFRKDK